MPSEPLNAVITVGTSVEQVAQINTDPKSPRIAILLRNVSTGGQKISVAFSNQQQAVAGSGIVLDVNDALGDSSQAGYEAWGGNITAVADAAGAKLAVYMRNR